MPDARCLKAEGRWLKAGDQNWIVTTVVFDERGTEALVTPGPVVTSGVGCAARPSWLVWTTAPGARVHVTAIVPFVVTLHWRVTTTPTWSPAWRESAATAGVPRARRIATTRSVFRRMPGVRRC